MGQTDVKCCEGIIRQRPPGPHPRIASPSLLRGRFGIEVRSNQEIDVESESNQSHIDVESTLNRCQIDPGGEGEADSWVRSGGSVPNTPSQVKRPQLKGCYEPVKRKRLQFSIRFQGQSLTNQTKNSSINHATHAHAESL